MLHRIPILVSQTYYLSKLHIRLELQDKRRQNLDIFSLTNSIQKFTRPAGQSMNRDRIPIFEEQLCRRTKLSARYVDLKLMYVHVISTFGRR